MPRKPDTTKDRYFDPFPSRLRDLMKANHTNQTKVAEILNLKNRQSVTGYIDGSTLPTIDKVLALAEYFHVSSDFLLGIKDVQSTNSSLQAACEYTGLTEQAAKNLCKIRDKNALTGLNLLLSSPLIEVLGDDIVRFADSCETYFSGDSNLVAHAKKNFPQLEILSGYDLIEHKRRQAVDRFNNLILMNSKYDAVQRDMIERQTGNIIGWKEAADDGQHTEG